MNIKLKDIIDLCDDIGEVILIDGVERNMSEPIKLEDWEKYNDYNVFYISCEEETYDMCDSRSWIVVEIVKPKED